jgi:hypothetical protein
MNLPYFELSLADKVTLLLSDKLDSSSQASYQHCLQ